MTKNFRLLYSVPTRNKLPIDKAQRAAKFEKDVQGNVSLRQDTDAHIRHNMEQAAQWDPSRQSYRTCARHHNYGWGDHPSDEYSRGSK